VIWLVIKSSLSTRGLKSHGNLECIVDNPLKAGKSTNHEDSCSETLPETIESNISVDLSNRLSSLIHDGDTGISWVRYDSAEDTSEITRGECDHHLSALTV